MANYSKLLLSTGGGIVSANQQAEQDDVVTIAIGLGGTGIDCLKNFKKEVYNRIKPDNPDEDIPKYRRIRFLAVDSDKSSLNTIDNADDEKSDEKKKAERLVPWSIDEATEFFPISNDHILSVLTKHEMLNARKDLKWFSHEDTKQGTKISIKNTGAGAGGVRQVGRYLLIDKSRDFVNKLQEILMDARKDVTGGINIHVFSGIGGGTGSGTFIDICYLIQYTLENVLGYGKGAYQLCGFFFLPDVNLSRPNLNSFIKQYIQINGYAAFKDLDYCMNFKSNGDHWDQVYKGFSYSTENAPVDLCHLISATNTANYTVEDPYGYAMNVVSDYCLDFVAKQNSNFTMDSHISNFYAQIDNIDKTHGALYQYCILGAANGEVPLKDITTYLATYLFSKFKSINPSVQPTRQDLERFMGITGITHDSLKREFTMKAPNAYPIPDIFDPKDVQISNAPVIKWFDNQLGKIMNQIGENQTAMSQELSSFNVRDVASRSVISRVMAQLVTAFVNNDDFGPFFSKNILISQDKEDLLGVINGIINQNKVMIQAEESQTELRENELNRAESAFKAARGGKVKKLYGDYIFQLQLWYQHIGNGKILFAFHNFLVKLSDQIKNLHAQYFVPLCEVLTNLKDTFRENERYFADKNNNKAKNSYTTYLMTIDDLKDSLRKTVDEMKVDAQLRAFMDEFVKDPGFWITKDEGKICRVVNKYLSESVFTEYSNRTIMDYLERKYETKDVNLLKNYIKTDIMRKLDHIAKPLFWNSSYFDVSTGVPTIAFCSLPYQAATIVNAGKEFIQGKPEFTLRETVLSDRIFMMRFYCGIPAFSYQGCEIYEELYARDKSAGKHLYERLDNDGVTEKDWRKIVPSLLPASIETVNHVNIDSIRESIESGSDLLRKARDCGIVQEINDQFFVVTRDFAPVEQLIAQADEAMAKKDVPAAKETGEKAAAAFAALREKTRKPIEVQCGPSGVPEDILKDNFIRFHSIRQEVSEEYDRYVTVKDAVADISRRIDAFRKDTALLSEFAEALFAGVFKIAGPNITFEHSTMGMTDTVTLSNPTMKYGVLPFYQAYLTYCEKKDEIGEDIKAITDQKKLTVDADFMQSVKNIASVLENKAYLQMQQTQINTKFIDESRAIKKFFEQLIGELQNFKALYMIF